MKILMTAVFMAMTSLAMASTVPTVTSLGFSDDGKSFAFLEAGIQDGSGFKFATVRFLDVATNSYSASAIKVAENEETEGTIKDVPAEALKQAAETLAKLGIKSKNAGSVLVSRKITDIDANKLPSANFALYPIIEGGATVQAYNLKIVPTKVTASKEMDCQGAQPYKMRVDLLNATTKQVQVLQNDSVLPKSRGCALSYKVDQVISIDNGVETTGVVTLIRVETPTYQGNDVFYMAVSGLLK